MTGGKDVALSCITGQISRNGLDGLYPSKIPCDFRNGNEREETNATLVNIWQTKLELELDIMYTAIPFGSQTCIGSKIVEMTLLYHNQCSMLASVSYIQHALYSFKITTQNSKRYASKANSPSSDMLDYLYSSSRAGK